MLIDVKYGVRTSASLSDKNTMFQWVMLGNIKLARLLDHCLFSDFPSLSI